MTAPTRIVDVHALPTMLTALRLPSFHRHWPMLAERADKEGWPAARFLATLAEIELAERETRRIRRHLIESQLPGGKTLATFDFKALPSVPRARVEALAAGDWIETGANLIAIGNSGAGKTHLLCAIGHALVEAGRRVLYTRTTDLVQKLQAARRDLALETALAKLDRFELIILDDIGYARKDQAETSVLFELIARRFETRSLAIAANQPFSAWDTVFPDQAVTVAAIDRLVHHATILEMNADSYRRRAAADRTALKADAAATPSADSLSTAPGRQKKADEQAIGRSRGGLSTKIHALGDVLGNPLAFLLTGGQAHERDGADVLLPGMTSDTLLADKAYDADERVLQKSDEAGKTAIIPPKANRISPRDYDKDTYKARHLIENLFCKLKLYRAIATCYDKTARNFLAAIHLAAAIVWLN